MATSTLPAHPSPLSRADAVELGQRIKAAATLWQRATEEADRHALTCGQLLEEAFERSAHRAVGVARFETWAKAATGLSPSHQARLRAHQDTLRKIAGAARVDVDDLASTPERVTRAARRNLGAVTATAARQAECQPRQGRVEGASSAMREERRQELDDERGQIVPMHRPAPAYSTGRGAPTIGDAAQPIDLDRLEDALELLASIDDPAFVVLSLPEGRAGVMRNLPKAALRVAALMDAWERRESEA